MQAVLFDTSIYITALRDDQEAVQRLRKMARTAPLWLSSVVLEELYAGARGQSERNVERLERDFERTKRILVPNLRDWTQAGRVLARLASKDDYEQIGRGRLTNDALIASSAGRWGITIVTANEGDFAKLAEFMPFNGGLRGS